MSCTGPRCRAVGISEPGSCPRNSPPISSDSLPRSTMRWRPEPDMDIAQARPFEIRVADDVLADLGVRLAATRLPPDQGPAGWDAGSNPDYLRALLDHWRSAFDWRAQEAMLNTFAHFH